MRKETQRVHLGVVLVLRRTKANSSNRQMVRLGVDEFRGESAEEQKTVLLCVRYRPRLFSRRFFLQAMNCAISSVVMHLVFPFWFLYFISIHLLKTLFLFLECQKLHFFECSFCLCFLRSFSFFTSFLLVFLLVFFFIFISGLLSLFCAFVFCLRLLSKCAACQIAV